MESKAQFCGRSVTLKPGQLICGIKEIADKWGISRTNTHKWMQRLVSWGRIEIEVGTLGCLVTIRDWEVYQHSDKQESTAREQVENKSGTDREQSGTLNKEVKKKKNKYKSDFDFEALCG
jgi:biotin operon repressor